MPPHERERETKATDNRVTIAVDCYFGKDMTELCRLVQHSFPAVSLPRSAPVPVAKQLPWSSFLVSSLFDCSTRLLFNMLFSPPFVDAGSHCLSKVRDFFFYGFLFLFLFEQCKGGAQSLDGKGGPLKTETWDIEPAVLYISTTAGALVIFLVNVAHGGKAFVCGLHTPARL